MKRPNGIGGFTLVEIMIAIVIGLFLTAGVVQMFVANKQTYRFNEALARMQENGRYALELMAADLRMADFWGCSRGESITNHVNKESDDYRENLHGFPNGLDGDDSPSGTAGDPDEITLRGGWGSGSIVQGHGSVNNPITVTGDHDPVEEIICGYEDCLDNTVADMVLVADCKGGDIFQVTDLATGSETGTSDIGFSAAGPDGTPGNDGTTLSDVYNESATLYPLRVATYCVSDSTDCSNPGVSGQRGLRRNSEEIAEGIENMQITYGEDTDDDGTANRYVPYTNVSDMANVVSVRVSLLLSSTEERLTADAAQTFDVNDETDTCPNGRICQLMSSTFTIRNRAR